MAKKTNLKRRSKEYKKDGYYKDYEERRKNAGKNARIKYKNVRRQVKKSSGRIRNMATGQDS